MEMTNVPTTPSASESESIAKLATALVAAQGEFPRITKDKTATVPMRSGGKYSYNYADLASVLGAVTPVLSKHGLAVVQRMRWNTEKLTLLLETRLLHCSGEWMASTYPLPTSGTPQEMGSSQTYARRYSLTSFLGIATEEDDDGKAGGGEPPAPSMSERALADHLAALETAADVDQLRKVNAAAVAAAGKDKAALARIATTKTVRYRALTAKPAGDGK